MNTKDSNDEQIAALNAKDDGRPIAITNLLKFHDRARYPEDAPEASLGRSGRAAYQAYAQAFVALIAEFGGSTVYWGDAVGYAIGNGVWDAVWINRFPNLAAVRAASTDPRYAEMHRHRDAGLDYQHAIVTRPLEESR